MTLMLILLLWQSQEPQTTTESDATTVTVSEEPEGVKLVKGQFLDLDSRWPVGEAFEAYPFFEQTKWSQKGDLIIFEGVMDDKQVTDAYIEEHEWSWRENFKAIHLESTYQITEDKDKLAFIFHFRLDGQGGFNVEKGFLGIRSLETGKWKRIRLDTKPIVKAMKGIYMKYNPYMSLIQGLPFK